MVILSMVRACWEAVHNTLLHKGITTAIRRWGQPLQLCLSHSTGYLQSLQTRNWKNLSLKDFIMFKKLLQAVSGASQTLSSTFEGLDSGMNLSMVGVRSCWEAIQSTGTMWRWGQPQCWNSTINYVPISLLAEVKLPSWNCLLSA